MKPSILSAGLAATAFASAPTLADDPHAELIEWVFAPCMEVAAALDVGDLEQDQRDLGIKREHIALLMLASRDSAIREVSGKMKAGSTWEERRAAYPVLFRHCLAQFSKG